MTEADFLRAEFVAAAIVDYAHNQDDPDANVIVDDGDIGGDQESGWMSWLNCADPPDTVDGWAGWLACQIVYSDNGNKAP